MRTGSDYQNTIKRFQDLIRLTKLNADLIAQYPSIMLGSPDPGQPSPCFDENFSTLQEVVKSLDEMTAEGQVALGESHRLNLSTANKEEKMGSKAAVPLSEQKNSEQPYDKSEKGLTRGDSSISDSRARMEKNVEKRIEDKNTTLDAFDQKKVKPSRFRLDGSGPSGVIDADNISGFIDGAKKNP